MEIMFLVRLLTSFIIAGLWIALATLFAERTGSKIGGLFTNLPSNILISMVFIALVHDPTFVVAAVTGVPIGMTINTVFLMVFIVLLPRGLWIASLGSLVTWFGMAVLFTNLSLTHLVFNCLFYLMITLVAFCLLEKWARIPSMPKSSKRYSWSQILWRAVFAGGVVAMVVLISKFCSPYMTGIFATFPAVLLSTMVILTINQGCEFARATGKILILSSTNIVVYAIAIYFCYGSFGILWGTVFGFAVAVGWVLLLRPVVRIFT